MAADDAGGPGQPSCSRLGRDLARIPDLNRAGLLSWYQQLYGNPAPSKMSRRLLELAIAYRLQEQLFGKLKASTRKAFAIGEPIAPSADAGMVLVREWQGVHHTVSVLDDGVAYRGKHYRSLSEVAKLITGLHRSGPVFFGLKQYKTRSAKPAKS